MKAIQFPWVRRRRHPARGGHRPPGSGPGQVLVQVAGTSFNPVGATIRAGHLQQVFPLALPHTRASTSPAR